MDNSPMYFNELLIVKDSSKRLLYNCFMNTVTGRRAFSYAGSRFWNKLPEAVRIEDNTEKFKRLIKTVLFRNTNNIMAAVQMYHT